MEFLVLILVVGVLVFVAKVLFEAFIVKAGIDLFRYHQAAFDRALREQQQILRQLPSQAEVGHPGVDAPQRRLLSSRPPTFVPRASSIS